MLATYGYNDYSIAAKTVSQGIAAPRGKMPVYASVGLGIVLLMPAISLPVFGISLVIIPLLDAPVIRRVPALRCMLGTR